METLSAEPAWLDIGAIEDIPIRGARRISAPHGDIAVFRTGDDEVFALTDRCPHKGGPLSQGIVHGRAVACPLHNWTIALDTGEPSGADAGKGCAPPHPTRVAGGRIYIALER